MQRTYNLDMAIEKATWISIGALALCGAACAGTAPVVLAAGGLTLGKAVFGTGAALSGHLVIEMVSRCGEWITKRYRSKDELTKNHDLRELVARSIEKVLDGEISKTRSQDGVDLLRKYRKNIHARLDAATDPVFEGIWEKSLVNYLKPPVDEFASVRALEPEVWIDFLEPGYHKLKHRQAHGGDQGVASSAAFWPTAGIGGVTPLNPEQEAALQAAANALHKDLAKTIVGVYRFAFEDDPTVFVAAITEILKGIWNGVDKLDSKTQTILDEIRALTKAMTYAHPVAMQTYMQDFAATADEFRAVLAEVPGYLRQILELGAKNLEVGTKGLEVGTKGLEVGTLTLDAINRLSAQFADWQQKDARARANVVNHGAADLTHEEIAQKIAPYLQSLITAHQKIELRGIRDGSDPVIRLELKDAYVPLQGKKKLQVDESDAERGGDHRRLHLVKGGREAVKEDADVPMKKVLGEGHRLAITGGAGSGKTTVLRYIAWWLAASRLGEPSAEEEFRLGLPADAPLPIPIFVSLAAFAPYRHAPPSYTSNFESFLADDLKRRDAKFDLPKELFELLLREGRNVILLLDGLDEVADDTQRASMRQWAGSFAADRPELRVVLTCRTIAWRKDSALLDFKDIAVQPLDMKTHIEPMVAKAYACIEPHNETERNKGIKQLVDGIKGLELKRLASLGADDRPLVDSPLMVRMMLIVQRSNVKLPDERADLFDKAVDAIYQVDHGIDEDTKPDFTQHWETYLEMAQRLAYHMHCEGVDKGRLIEKEGGVDKVFAAPSEYHPFIKRFLDYAQKRGGVLEEYGGPYRFVHHAFQEFLVARYLRTVEAVPNLQKIINVVTSLLADPWWREPILLTAGYKARESRSTVIYFIEQLAAAGKSADEQFSGAELAGIAALEWGDCPAVLRVKCANRILELLNNKDALEHSQPVIRARAGDVLARLGDPRFDPARFYLPVDTEHDLLGFKEIPEDKDFMIGTPSGEKAAQRIKQATGYEPDAYEINDASTHTRRFYIARYPVTVAQFKAFVDAKKAVDANFTKGDDDTLRDPGNHPVQSVNWHEARDYCKWLQEQLLNEKSLKNNEIVKLIQKDWEIDLPSELEWEQAARGGERNRVFPWGNDADANRANYDDTKIGGTSPVGCFEPNHGLYDMAGNVWEWTRSLWGKEFEKPDFGYPYEQSTVAERENLKAADDVSWVVRGGSWLSLAVSARCAFRRRDRPDLRRYYLGFRVVLRSPPVK